MVNGARTKPGLPWVRGVTTLEFAFRLPTPDGGLYGFRSILEGSESGQASIIVSILPW